MSNYYISDCCEAEASEIFNHIEGVCSECGEPCDLIAILDN